MENYSWGRIIQAEKQKPYLQNIQQRLDIAYNNNIQVFPERGDIFNALTMCPLLSTKVVILGQDPYHQPKQAHGLAFSVQKDVVIPKSLVNIFKELVDDCGVASPLHGDLSCWAQQGVLLLNTILTVEQGKPLSHVDWEWQRLTLKLLKILNTLDRSIIFVLWGKYANDHRHIITNKKHFIMSAPHPSPLSAHRGFFGCRHFSAINKILAYNKQTPISWGVT